MGSFVNLDVDSVEIIQAGLYYGVGHTNKKAATFAFWDTLEYLSKFIQGCLSLRYPV